MWQEISGGLDLIKVGNYETSSRGYVGRFNFKGVQQQQVIGDLSGGERNRVHLAKVLKSGGNVLLLDEPTNDLDIETLRALEDALVAFPRLRGGHFARSLVPGPHRDAHSSHSRAIPRWCGSREIIRSTSRTIRNARARTPPSRTASATKPLAG